MDPIVEELVKDVKALQWPIYANLVLGFLTLVVGLFIRTSIARSEARFKSKLQVELELRKQRLKAKIKLISTEQNLFHEVEKVAKGTAAVDERDALAKELRKMVRDASGIFPREQFQSVLEVVNQLTDEILGLSLQQPLPESFIGCRRKVHQALDQLDEFLWS